MLLGIVPGKSYDAREWPDLLYFTLIGDCRSWIEGARGVRYCVRWHTQCGVCLG